jgi:hypothetical protein
MAHCTKLKKISWHVVRTGIEMDPIRHDDDEFLHSIIREDTQHEGPFVDAQ